LSDDAENAVRFRYACEPLEVARIASRTIHSIMLSINSAVEACPELKCAIAKADAVTAAVARSTKLQHRFKEFQQLAAKRNLDHDQRSLVSCAETRWRSVPRRSFATTTCCRRWR
jgi:hypothetical protein